MTEAGGAPLIEVSGLTKRFDVRKGAFARIVAQVHAVENVSFQIRQGEVLGLAGESGSGKTTIGRMLLRLIEATSGSIRFMGEEITAFDRARLLAFRRQAQIVFQDPFASLDPTMTIGEAIAEPLRIQGMSARAPELRQRIAELLDAVEIGRAHV